MDRVTWECPAGDESRRLQAAPPCLGQRTYARVGYSEEQACVFAGIYTLTFRPWPAMRSQVILKRRYLTTAEASACRWVHDMVVDDCRAMHSGESGCETLLHLSRVFFVTWGYLRSYVSHACDHHGRVARFAVAGLRTCKASIGGLEKQDAKPVVPAHS